MQATYPLVDPADKREGHFAPVAIFAVGTSGGRPADIHHLGLNATTARSNYRG